MNQLENVQYHRERGYTLPMPAISDVLCTRCGSGEVQQPGQTMDMPMYFECLRCGRWAESSEWRVVA